jgi:hypothetical protein
LATTELTLTTDLAVQYGGSGAGTFTDHGVLLGSGTSAFSVTAAGTTNNVLTAVTGNDPAWAQVDLASMITGILPVSNGGTGLATITDHGIMVGSGTGAVTPLAVGATGETVMGSTGADPTWTSSPSFGGTVTAATGMSITANDLDIVSGSLLLPTTSATDGQIQINSNKVFHAYGDATNPNIFIGLNSGNFTLTTATAKNNVGVGKHTFLDLTIGTDNSAVGYLAMQNLTEGNRNAAIGSGALGTCSTGDRNSCNGFNGLALLQTGSYNTTVGSNCLFRLTTGSNNICIGTDDGAGTGWSGQAYTGAESNNILIGSAGVLGESNKIRIGTSGAGQGQQDICYIAGCYNVTPAGTIHVGLVDSNGQFGSEAQLAVARGGTGAATLTDHGVLVGSGTSAVSVTAVGTNGQALIGSTGADPVFATLGSTLGTMQYTTGAGTLALDCQVTQALSGFASWDGAGPYFDDTTLGQFEVSESGVGYIKGKRITWAAPQTETGLTAGNTYYIYIDDTGTIGKTTTYNSALFRDNIVLFECMRDSTAGTNIQVTVKENHPYQVPWETSVYLHDTIGVAFTAHGGGANIILDGTQKIAISGADELEDHGLETDIPDSGGTGVTWKQYFTLGSGKWAQNSSTDTFVGEYNNAGTATALGANKFGVYKLYASKDNITVTTPTYFAVLHTAQFNNLAAAQTAIADGTIASATNELFALEMARLGYIVFAESSTSIVDVIIDKETVGTGGTIGGTNIASLVLTDVTNFNGILSAADTTVQAALETIDDMGDPVTVAHGGTGLATITDHGIMVGSGVGAVTPLAVGATNEILIGNTGADPTWSSTPTVGTLYTSDTADGLTITSNTIVADGSNANIDVVITPKGTATIDCLPMYGYSVGGTNSAVIIDNTGLMGTTSSSLRYKENIQDMADHSSSLMDLRPVVFNWKKDEEKVIQYGLIAEEVAEKMPEIVNFDKDGRPESIRYHDMPAILLNELKKQRELIIMLTEKIANLETLVSKEK